MISSCFSPELSLAGSNGPEPESGTTTSPCSAFTSKLFLRNLRLTMDLSKSVCDVCRLGRRGVFGWCFPRRHCAGDPLAKASLEKCGRVLETSSSFRRGRSSAFCEGHPRNWRPCLRGTAQYHSLDGTGWMDGAARRFDVNLQLAVVEFL